MAVYEYAAQLQDSDELSRGVIIADTPREAREQLRDQGMQVRSLTSMSKRGENIHPVINFIRTIQSQQIRTQVTTILRELATLLGAGLPLLTALETISKEKHHPRLHQLVFTLKDLIASGTSLASAMADCNQTMPGTFDELSINLVETGEHTGTLEVTLERLAEFRETSEQFKDRVKNALMYPVMVAAVGLAVCLFLMTFVVPKLVNVVQETGQDLPMMTLIVKAISDFLIRDWAWLLGVTTVTFISFFIWRKTPGGQGKLDQLAFHLPLIGAMNRKQSISRVMLVLATLLESGIVFTSALVIARRTVRNSLMQAALMNCHDAVTKGENVHKALDQTGLFPASVVQVFAVGKESGKLEPMLKRLSTDYDQQVQLMAGRLTALLQPIMIVALSILVGMVALATILPIMKAGQIL